MAILNINIDTIWDGFMPSALFGSKSQYLLALGIDPDMPLTDDSTDVKASGAIRPVNYSGFSGANVTSYPVAILSTPKNTNIYVVLANGRLISYDSSFGSETLIGTVAGSVANGAVYYNNYIYITTGTDVSRYGPLDNSPSLANNWWTSIISLTALTNTTYPTTLLSASYLNHYGITHVDGAAYFLDYKNGQGMVHKILTSKTTNEGDTNNGSAYNVLNLPFNYMPMAIAPYGTNLVISASLTSNSSILQGRSALFFWDTTSQSFYQQVALPDAICSALIFVNGVLYGLTGDLNGGYRLFEYRGGESIANLKIIEDGHPPLQGAIAAIGNRIVWAADTTVPSVGAGLYAYGSKSDLFPKGLHHIATTTF